MNKLPLIVAALAGSLALASDGGDMAVVQKWKAAKVVRYRVEGVHTGRVSVVKGDYEAKADVVDRLTVEFTWDVKKRKVVGSIAMTDGKSELSNIKSDGTNCGPPQLKGDYEHFRSVSSSQAANLIQINGVRTYPAASVSNYPASCSMHAIPAGKEDATLWVGGAGTEILGMPRMAGPVTIAADRKSYSMKGAENWVWTYTPTLLE